MNIHDFMVLYDSREKCLRALFAEKNAQYGVCGDVFENNNIGSALANISPEKHALMQASKHFAKLIRLADELDKGVLPTDLEAWRESMDDLSMWMFIINGLLEERFQRRMVKDGT